jgi:hypothetical protein
MVSHYRGDIQAAKYINEHFKNQSVIVLGNVPARFEFYCKIPVVIYKNPGPGDIQNIEQPVLLLFTNVKTPDPANSNYVFIRSFDNYNGDAVTLSFLNPNTRSKKLNKYTLLSKNLTIEESHFISK